MQNRFFNFVRRKGRESEERRRRRYESPLHVVQNQTFNFIINQNGLKFGRGHIEGGGEALLEEEEDGGGGDESGDGGAEEEEDRRRVGGGRDSRNIDE